MNQTVTTDFSSEQAARFFASFMPMFIVMMLVFLIGFSALMFWGILRKAGRPGWWSLIPVYNWGQVSEVVGKPAWWGWVIGLGQLLPLVIWMFLFSSMSTWMQSGPPTGPPAFFGLFGVVWLLGVAGFVLQIMLAIAVVRAFGQPDVWAVGVVLLPYIFYPIIGLGSSIYAGPGPHQAITARANGLPPLPPPLPPARRTTAAPLDLGQR